MSYDCKLSFAVLGEVGVGKSSLLLRFAKNIFREHLTTTIIDCYHANVLVRNKRVRLELWDTAGQERYRCIMKNYYRKADGVLLVYDVTNLSSFFNLTGWFLQLKAENETAVSIVVGNKIDHPAGKAVAVSSAKAFATEQNIGFYESSSKTGENVNQIFEDLTEKVLEAKGILPSKESQQKPYKNAAKKEDNCSTLAITPTPKESVVKLHLPKKTLSIEQKRDCC